jgi:D-proline reductase (dithiol) PrdB
VLETAGIPTVVLSTARDISAQVRAPRTAFVNAPMGNTFGRPFDRPRQRAILLEALRIFETVREGGTLLDLPFEWDQDFSIFLGQSS